MMEELYKYGYPEIKRQSAICDAVMRNKIGDNIYQHFEYRGKEKVSPIIEVPIQLLVYRTENIRTKSLQRQWLALNENAKTDFFTADPYSIETQTIQHKLLTTLIDKENLKKFFKDTKNKQSEPLICTDNGIVVNGNRRLCAWRELYYSDKIRYAHFQTIRVLVLPDHDPEGMYSLEVALQIRDDMKSEYSWHAISADCKEKKDNGIHIKDIAEKLEMKVEDVQDRIECYLCAAEYLESIGHADEWSLVDKQEYAFKQIVEGRRKINNAADKELFKEITKAMLLKPAQGERLFRQIKKVSDHLQDIANKLKETFDIPIDDEDDDDLNLLLGGDSDNDNSNAKIAQGIRTANNPELVVSTVQNVLETSEELDKEKKKKTFIFDQVSKAATILTQTINSLDDSMSTKGVKKQLDNIANAVKVINGWLVENEYKD